MIFLDTSFVVAWVNPNDFLHERALTLLDRFHDEPWLTTDCVLLEIGNSLSRHFRNEAAEVIETILSDEDATIVSMDADLFSRDHQCLDALTNDVHFIQAGFMAHLRHPE